MSMRERLGALTLALARPRASAQWLELSTSMIANPFEVFSQPEPGEFGGSSGDRVGVTGLFTFSTSAPPTTVTTLFVIFDIADFSVTIVDLHPSGDAPVTLTPLTSTAGLFYSIESDSLTVLVMDSDHTYTFVIDSPAGSFSPGMRSLPDLPADYAFDGATTDQVSASYQDAAMAFPADTDWSPASGYENNELVSYMLRAASEPAGPACSQADLAPPFGVHDFSDVLAFLTAFGAGCP